MKACSRLRRQSGVAAIEFAILLIPLLVLFGGMTELGRAFYQYNTLVVSVRDATRHLSKHNRGEAEDEARCLAVYGKPACAGDVLAGGLTTDMVSIAYEVGVETGHGSLDLVRVSITGYPFVSLVPAVVDHFAFGPISATMRQGGT